MKDSELGNINSFITELQNENKILMAQYQELLKKYNQLAEEYRRVNDEHKMPVESRNQRVLKKAKEIVEENMNDPSFSVMVMANLIGMSRTNLHRKMKEISGITPSVFINQIRLKKAALLLLNQVDFVAQVGFTVGFSDQSYFSKSFKKEFGISPSKYSQVLRQN